MTRIGGHKSGRLERELAAAKGVAGRFAGVPIEKHDPRVFSVAVNFLNHASRDFDQYCSHNADLLGRR